MLQTILIALLLAVLGAVMLFLGYRFFRFLVPFWGFFAGFSAGAQAIASILGTGFLGDITGWIVGLVVGAALAFLAYTFYKIAIILLGVSLGYSIGAGLMAALGFGTGFLAVVVGLVVGVILGLSFFVLNIPKMLVVAYTAAAGSGALLAGLLLLLGVVPLAWLGTGAIGLVLLASWIWALVWLVVMGVGIYVQMRYSYSYILQPY